MSEDLFLNDKERLIEYLKHHRYVKSSDIIRWGCENHSNRADRNKRELVKVGLLRRLTSDEKDRFFGMIKEDVYEVRVA